MSDQARALLGRRSWRFLVCVAVVAVLVAWGLPVFGVLSGGSQQFQSGSSEYERANRLFRRLTGQRAYYSMDVLLEADTRRAGRESAAVAAGRVAGLISRRRGFERRLETSAGGREVVVVMAAFASPGESVAAASRVRGWLSSGRGRSVLAGWRVIFGGPDLAFHELEALTSSDVEQVERFAVPVLCVLCFLVFDGAAFILPLLVGALTAIIAFGVLRFLDLVGVEISVYSLPAVTGLALGLGVDYSLLMVDRYRQERDHGSSPAMAHGRMGHTAGRTVSVSSLTIAVAMAVLLLLFPLPFLVSIGIAAAVTAVVAGVLARVLLPRMPLLAVRRLNITKLFRGPFARGKPDCGFWRWLAGWVTGHPAPVAGLSTVVLLAMAAPALGLGLVAPSARLLPAASEARWVERALARDFSFDPAGAIYTIYQPKGQDAPVAMLARREARLAGGQARVLAPRYIGSGAWEISLLPHGDPDSPTNQHLLAELLKTTAPSGTLTGGIAAYAVDQKTTIASRLLPALLAVGLVSLVALWLLSGSVVIAVKGIVMALLSAAAGIGLLVAILGPLEEANLIFTVAVAVALSTDYEIFLISSIREHHTHGHTNRQAITTAVANTGPLITAAALLFCIAVGALALSPLFFARQFGLGATLTVLIDATLIRALLVPSLMSLLGERNWWSPSLLARLHRRIETLKRSPVGHQAHRLIPSTATADARNRAVASCKQAGGY